MQRSNVVDGEKVTLANFAYWVRGRRSLRMWTGRPRTQFFR